MQTDQDHDGLNIIVVGAGIGGVAAAVALRLAGHRVTVLEQANAFGQVGAGIQLAPNATRILSQLGIADALRPTAVAPERVVRRSWQDGVILGEHRLGESVAAYYGAPYWHVHRADLHQALIAAAGTGDGPGEQVVFHLGKRVVDLDREGSTGSAVITESGERYVADLVVGADGVHSLIRTLLFGADNPPDPRGVGYRALIPAEVLQQKPQLQSILGGEPDLTEWLSPGVHFIHYYISGRQYLNAGLMRYTPDSDPGVESWLREGDKQEMLALLEGWDARLVALAACADNVFCTGVYQHEPSDVWVQGSVCLLGDACHAMMPTQAQGAAQAIEDAWFLGKVLAGVDASTLESALIAYQEERIPRTTAVKQLSSLDRGAGLGNRKTDAATEEPSSAPEDFSPYDWLWSYGNKEPADT